MACRVAARTTSVRLVGRPRTRGARVHEVPAGRDAHPGGVRRRRPRTPTCCSWARAPGEQEDLTGEPFVGRAGRLLTSLIEGIGLTRAEVYIANVVKCRPPGNRDPLPLEIETCRPYLEAQVEFIEPAGRRDARQLRHQAAARHQGRASPSCAGRSSRSATARCSSRCSTRRRCCATAAPRSRRRAPTSSPSSARSRARPASMTSCARRRATRRRDARARRSGSARCCAPGDVVVLDGELGTGKTVFAKGIAVGARRHRAGGEPDVHRRARVRRPTAARARRRVPPRPPAGAARPRASTSCVDGDAVTVVEWGDRVSAAAARRPPRRAARAGRRRRRPRVSSIDGRRAPSWARAARRRCSTRSRRRPGRLTCSCSRSTPSTAQVSVAIGDDGAVLGEVQLDGGRRHAEQLAPAIEYLCRELRRRPRPARRVAVGHRPGPVHRPAGRRDDRQGDGAGAAHPGGRRPEPRPGRLPAAAHEPHDRGGARRPPPRGVRRPLPAGARRRAAHDRLRGARAGRAGRRARGRLGRVRRPAARRRRRRPLPGRVRRARPRRAGRARVRGAERRRAGGAGDRRAPSARSSSSPASCVRSTSARATPRSSGSRKGRVSWRRR